MKKKFNCPLCHSILTENKFLTIIGVWDDKVKIEKELKEKLRTAEKEKKIAIKDGIEKGKQKEKSRADRLAKQADSYLDQIKEQNEKIKQLQRQLKEGTTAQSEGLDFEKELIEQLGNEFSEDFIEHHGKDGDILHRIFHKSGEIGSILYECKKTAKFNQEYIHQTKRAIAARNANYGILVSFAAKKNTQGFYVDNDIIVVHPFGAIHIAQVLRNALIDMYSLKIDHRQLEERAQQLMDFIKSNDFKNSVENTIYRAQELAKMLIAEYKSHKRTWKKRLGHYNGIYANANVVQLKTKNILNGHRTTKSLMKTGIKKLPSPDGV
jgi:hypothetical protein